MNKRASTLQAKERPSIAPETREAILAAMTRKALQGNTAAAKIVLEESRDNSKALNKLDTLLSEFRAAVGMTEAEAPDKLEG